MGIPGFDLNGQQFGLDRFLFLNKRFQKIQHTILFLCNLEVEGKICDQMVCFEDDLFLLIICGVFISTNFNFGKGIAPGGKELISSGNMEQWTALFDQAVFKNLVRKANFFQSNLNDFKILSNPAQSQNPDLLGDSLYRSWTHTLFL